MFSLVKSVLSHGETDCEDPSFFHAALNVSFSCVLRCAGTKHVTNDDMQAAGALVARSISNLETYEYQNGLFLVADTCPSLLLGGSNGCIIRKHH